MSVGRVFEFNDHRLEADRRQLTKAGQTVALLPKAFDVLLYLLEHRDRVVTKAELLRAVWPDTFVEASNLAQNISVLRRALGESPRGRTSIATIPGRGYRFTANVQATGTPSLEPETAYQLFLRGRHALSRRLTPTLREAIGLFVRSTDTDPTYAPAWVGLADAYALLSLYGASKPRDVFPKSKAAATTALALDPQLAPAHTALGVVALFYDWNWEDAERSLRKALDLDPGSGDAYQRFGIYLTVLGRFEEASDALTQAQTLDPLSRIIGTIAGYPAYYSRDFERAVRQFRLVLEMDPDFSMAHFRLGLALAHLGRHADALDALHTSRRLSNDRDVIAALGQVHAMIGDRPGAEAALAELHERSRDTFVSPYAVATIHAALGAHETALDWLERALEERSYWMIYLQVDPALDALRTHPRFEALLGQTHPFRPVTPPSALDSTKRHTLR